MPAINIILDKDGPFFTEADRHKVIELKNTITVTAIDGGMGSGAPSVAFIFELPDGKYVFSETSLALFLTAGDAFKAKYGDPRCEVASSPPTPEGREQT